MTITHDRHDVGTCYLTCERRSLSVAVMISQGPNQGVERPKRRGSGQTKFRGTDFHNKVKVHVDE